MNLLKAVIRYVKGLPRLYSIGGGVALVAIVAIGVHAATGGTAAVVTPSQTAHVRVASVGSLSLQTVGPLPVTGTVSSLDQASILAQSSGEVVRLVHALGDYVPAGGVIGELENSSQRAAVLQAKGVYDAAQANFANANGTTAQNSGVGASQAVQNVANAQNSVNTSMQSLYAALDDAVHTKADLLFSSPRSNPILQLTVTDNQLVITLQNQRASLEQTLAAANAKANATSRTDIDADSLSMAANAQSVVAFLNNLVDAVNKAVPNNNVSASALSGYQTSIGGARSSVTAALSALLTAKTAYDSAASTAVTTSNTAGAGTTNSISAAQAQVTQAQGALDAARASLEKTIIRSPISGTIISLPLTRGSFVTINSPVAQVSNPGALQVQTYVTSGDAKTLVVGGTATIAQNTQGVVVSIAPALDPTTGKILVKLGIVGSQKALTDGDTVSVSIARATPAQIKRTTTTASAPLIPIVAAKITPKGPVAFSVSASSTLVALPITLGTILGDQITILGGLAADTVIVTDARGLSDGQTVVVDTQ